MGDWFEDVPFDGSPYMTMTVQAKEEVKKTIPAVLHVDGSARLQTVGPLAAPLYRALIRLFYALTVSSCIKLLRYSGWGLILVFIS